MSTKKVNKRYTPEFKKLVVETMRDEKLSYRQTAERFEIRHKRVQDWMQIYLDEGVDGLFIDRRVHSKGRPRKELSESIAKDKKSV